MQSSRIPPWFILCFVCFPLLGMFVANWANGQSLTTRYVPVEERSENQTFAIFRHISPTQSMYGVANRNRGDYVTIQSTDQQTGIYFMDGSEGRMACMRITAKGIYVKDSHGVKYFISRDALAKLGVKEQTAERNVEESDSE